MEPQGYLECSQGHATDPSPEPGESSLEPHILFLIDQL
jgi:hypothetical protein